MNAGYAWLARYAVPCVVSVYGNEFLTPWIPITRRRVPVLGSRINHRLRVEGSRKLLRESCPRAGAILAISEYSKEAFLEKHPRCAGRVRAVYGGVDAAWLETARTLRGGGLPVRLITVCRLEEPRKNVDLTLEALARLSKRFAFEYIVVGDGPLKPVLEQRSRSLGIGERVRFLGHVADTELVERLVEGDLFVLVSSRDPYSFEGLGLVYLEANAVGTPVLAAKVGGAAEAVRDGVSGFFVEKVSVEGIEAAIARFLSGGIRFDGEACRAHAARFTWEATVDAVESVYGKVLEEWGRPATTKEPAVDARR
jgi:phosphatidylinositol alpha-1,6-mannosyltransferase